MTGDTDTDHGGRDRGQSYVLEAIGAAIIVLASVVFVLQATAVTPLSVSTASQHVENQERMQAETLLDHAARNGTLRAAVLNWNANNRSFLNATGEGYLGSVPDDENTFLSSLGRVFGDSQIATNVVVYYSSGTTTKSKRMLYQGTPSENAVSASHVMTLYDDGNLTANGFRGFTLNGTNSTTDFYAPDIEPGGPTYNVVEVRVVVWRM